MMTLDTLGVSALLYALAGYWTGRYGETTGRDRAHAPLLAVVVFTVAIAFAGLGLHFLLGEEVSARRALFEALLPGVALNLLLGGADLGAEPGRCCAGRRLRPRDGGAAPWLARSPSAARRPGASCRPTRGWRSRTASRRSSRSASACSRALALAIFAVLFLRLWALQVLSGDRYLNAAQNNQLRTVPVEAPRGSILDRAGNTIVSNVPGTAVQIWTADLPKEGRYAMLKRLSKVLRVPLPRLTKALEEGKDDPLTPILVKTAVHEDQVVTCSSARTSSRASRSSRTYLRNYENRALAAQVLGYVGEISPEELERLEQDGYRGGEKIGKTGVEAAFDTYLRGTAGAAQLRVDSLGRPAGQAGSPSAGRRSRGTTSA